MQVVKYQDGRCRCVCWELPETGWADVARHIDPFLVQAIQAIAAEYADDPVQWLEINYWPASGRLIVFPAQDGPWGHRGERVYFELHSRHLDNDLSRIDDALVWEQEGECLRNRKASLQLAEARQSHRLRLAAFDYDFGEGLFHLSELDEEAATEMQRELANFKRQYGVGV